MKLKKHTENQNTEIEEQRLKEDTEDMRRHYGMLIDHHIIDFDMFENKVGKENVPEILQEYNKILMKCELKEYEPDFVGICEHGKVDCALQVPCPIGLKCNHEHEHSNAKMCYMNKQGGELETFLLKNNTSVPKLLEMEKTIAETKQEDFAKNDFSTYDTQTEPNPKGEQKTCYTTYELTRREQEGKESKQCPHLQFKIGSEYCRTCRYFVSHDLVYRTVKCSYPNPVPDPSLGLFKNNQQ